MNLVGRKREKRIMARLLTDDDSIFLTVYGRRRIGKTYLIR
jgi:AAA+ ATPase superfamily predicted ATPase